jgi:hypothetical protein
VRLAEWCTAHGVKKSKEGCTLEVPLDAGASRGMVHHRTQGKKEKGVVLVGGSARRCRVSRNGAPHAGVKREKMGGEEAVSFNGATPLAAHLFPSPSSGGVHHSASERSERAESQSRQGTH